MQSVFLEERMGKELGILSEQKIPDFLVALGRTVEVSGLSYEEWQRDKADVLESLAASYMK